MDKWEKVFKYAVYMAYEIVGYARCPDSAAWGKSTHENGTYLFPSYKTESDLNQ